MPKNNVLLAIAFAVTASVICTWSISTYFHNQNQHQFDRLYDRMAGIERSLDHGQE